MTTLIQEERTLPTSEAIREVFALVREEFEATNQSIEAYLASDVSTVTKIGHYIVNSGGKRLRPMMAVLVARALGHQGNDAVKLAVLIEFLHTAMLLHDDVIDQSERRRGRKTVNLIWGNAATVLVGDFLHSRAFQLMVEIGSMEIMQVIADATNLIAQGEVMQLEHIGDPDLSESEYMEIIQFKSALLFQAAAETGASLANAKPTNIEAARLFGLHFGLAYQLLDDLLDYCGESNTLGKNVGIDLAEGKTTLPLIFAMRHCSSDKADFIRQAIQDRTDSNTEQVLEIVKSSGALAYTRTNAIAQIHLAKSALIRLPPSRYRDGLMRLSDIAVEREH